MAFENLSRRHAIKIAASADNSVEECGLAVGSVVGHGSVLSASRMNGSVVLFLDSVDKVNEIVTRGVIIKDTLVNVLPLVTPAKRITLSNVPPFIKDEILERELARYGQLMSSIKKVPLGCKSPLLKHVVSFRRHVYMILKDYSSDLNVAFKFKIDNFDYVVFATTESMKCFGCGKEGHLIRSCPEKKTPAAQDAPVNGERENVGNNLSIGVGEDRETGPVEGEGEEVNGGHSEGVKETGPSSDPVVASADSLPVSTDILSNAGGNAENSESTQSSNDNTNDILSVMLEKISNDLMDDKDKTTVQDAEPVLCAETETDESVFKTPNVKRKKSSRRSSRGAKKVAGVNTTGDIVDDMVAENADTENDSSDSLSCSPSPSGAGVYTLSMIKSFLDSTKNVRGVRVEDHFPDLKGFVRSVQHLRSLGSFTDPEVHRLRKFQTKLNQQIDDSDNEAA